MNFRNGTPGSESAALRKSRKVRAVVLDQDVFDKYFSRCIREVDDHIGTLRHAQQQGVTADGVGKQPRVLAQSDEWLAIAESQFEETRVAAVQNAEAIFSPLNIQKRLCLAIDDPDIAECSIVVERVKEQCSIGVETAILKTQRDVKRLSRQHIAIDQVLFQIVRGQKESGQTMPDIAGGDVHRMVVVPHGGWTLGEIRLSVQHGNRIGVEVIPSPSWQDVEIGITIGVCRIMAPVQMDGVFDGQLVVGSYHDRLTDTSTECRTRVNPVITHQRSGYTGNDFLNHHPHPHFIPCGREGFIPVQIGTFGHPPVKVLGAIP
jgi:hypothetical protein